MRVTYLTGQAPFSVELGPIILPATGSITISADPNNALQLGNDGGLYVFETIGNDGGLDLTVLFDNQII